MGKRGEPMGLDEAAALAGDVHRLALDYDTAMDLLADVIATLRLPANRFLIAKKLPEAEPVIDRFIQRYARHFEGK